MRFLLSDDQVDDNSTILWADGAGFLNVGNCLRKYMVLSSLILENSLAVEGVYSDTFFKKSGKSIIIMEAYGC
jgi:hypothetical protein